MFFKRNKDTEKTPPTIRITESSSAPSSKAMVETLQSLQYYIHDLIDVLKIDFPDFCIVGFLFEFMENTIVQYEFRPAELPPDAPFHSLAGYTPDNSNTVHLAEYTAVPDKESLIPRYVQLSSAETLFTIAHEFRHIWQRQHHGDLYAENHAFGMAVIDDFFEIDADAFATAYVFSSKTTFSPSDFPNVMELICLQGVADNGKRWSLSYDLAKQYSFGDTEKISSAKSSFPVKF